MILAPGTNPELHAHNLRELNLHAYASEIASAATLTGAPRTRALRLAIEHAAIACDGYATWCSDWTGTTARRRDRWRLAVTERDALHSWLAVLSVRYHEETRP